MNKPRLDIQAASGFEQKINRIGETGKPYTIKIEISDDQQNTYAVEFDVLTGRVDSHAMQKGIVACFELCEGMPVKVLLKDVCYMATA